MQGFQARKIYYILYKDILRISMEKDWVVVLYGDDSSHLASVNANVRTIDQVAEICNDLFTLIHL